ncbi:unnamed protein product [Trifolium pratense]|uniref:Uncharacterized protein n=1 Tax=Trifolium pratense TaxID=57577 RepID=A0ACB0JG29_TRIPR|nr:unnamed protein product [Trifolium pratense]
MLFVVAVVVVIVGGVGVVFVVATGVGVVFVVATGVGVVVVVEKAALFSGVVAGIDTPSSSSLVDSGDCNHPNPIFNLS